MTQYAIFSWVRNRQPQDLVPVGVVAWSPELKQHKVRFVLPGEHLADAQPQDYLPYVALIQNNLTDWEKVGLPYSDTPLSPFEDDWWVHVRKLLNQRICLSEPTPLPEGCTPDSVENLWRKAMLKHVKVLRDYRCFKAGEVFDFRPGINLLVGEQGTGKSTLLEQIKLDGKEEGNKKPVVAVEADPIKLMSFDFEKDTPRGKSYFSNSIPMMSQVTCLYVSHGQMNNYILKELENQKQMLFMMDEPDMALSIRSARKLVDKLKKAEENGCQVVAAVHHPIIIEKPSRKS